MMSLIDADILIEEADLIIKYALNNHIELDQKDIEIVLSFKEYLKSSSKENFHLRKTEFLLGYQNIAQKIKPVTLENINDSLVMTKRFSLFKFKNVPISKSAKFLNQYKTITLVTFILLLIFQFYWLVGIMLVTRSSETAQKIKNNEYDLSVIDTKKHTILYNNSIEEEILLETTQSINKEALCRWKKTTSIKNLFDYTDCDETTPISVIARSVKFKLNILDSYLLPLLYGLLGALIFILRTMSSEIKNFTFRLNDKNHYNTRLYLGSIAGLGIGWFMGSLNQSDNLDLVSISPLAFSFIAGYSIEFFFSTIDRFIKNFKSN